MVPVARQKGKSGRRSRKNNVVSSLGLYHKKTHLTERERVGPVPLPVSAPPPRPSFLCIDISPSPGPGQRNKQIDPATVRVGPSVLCSADPRPEPSSLNPSSYRRPFLRLSARSPLNRPSGTLGPPRLLPSSIEPAERNLCFASAFRLGTNYKQSSSIILNYFLKAKTNPQPTFPSSFPHPQYFPVVLPYPSFYPLPGLPQHPAAGSV